MRPRWRSVPAASACARARSGGDSAGQRPVGTRLVGEAASALQHAREQRRRRLAGGEARRGQRRRPTVGIGLGRMATPGRISAAIASSARMRFSTFGWVENRLSMRAPVSGLTMKSGAEAGLRSALGSSMRLA